jgi:hypothetical protein
MIHRIRRSLRWFGAVAALLLLALPVWADDIEPEPYVEEEVVEPEPEPVAEAEKEAKTETAAATSSGPSVGSKIFDCAVLRPFGFVRTIVGGALFVPAVVLAAPGGADNIQTAWEHFVAAPVEDTFKRPLGEL